MTWHTGSFGPGEVDGTALARTFVATCQALGIASPQDLMLSDGAQRIDEYHLTYFGLTLNEAD